MKAIIVSHPTNDFKACLYGLKYDNLCKLAELRHKNKETIKKRFRTIEVKDEIDLSNKTEGISKYKITNEMYEQEVKSYFNI